MLKNQFDRSIGEIEAPGFGLLEHEVRGVQVTVS